jgi:LysM repeat protein
VENSAYASLYDLLNGTENQKPDVIFASAKITESGKADGYRPKTTISPSKPSSKVGVTGSRSYVVKVGDTLSGIAAKFSGMTVSKIKALNGLTKSVINPGMRLIISRL